MGPKACIASQYSPRFDNLKVFMLKVLNFAEVLDAFFLSLLADFAAACRLTLVAASFGSSFVQYLEHISLKKRLRAKPRSRVVCLSMVIVFSECICNLASKCHLASRKMSLLTFLLSSRSNRPSITGIAHCKSQWMPCIFNIQLTQRISSKL